MQWATAAETQAICDALPLWLDDQRQLLEQDYVMLKIDDVNDTGGVEIFEKMSKGMMVGVPFHAIYDAAGASLNLVAARMWTGLQGLAKCPLTSLLRW